MTAKDQHLVLIDGYGFVFRAFHACPPLIREDGLNVGAVYGFTSMLIKVILERSCSHLAVVFDSGGKNFRHEIFPAYKSHRPPAPPELIPQFPLVREAVSALNIDIIEKPGFEADDIIATFAKSASNQGIKVTIISSDKDLMQLIDDNIHMFDSLKSKTIKEAEVFEKFGVRPDQVTDVLALIGDRSDFVPGVPGIGAKGAAELIQQYNSLAELYQNIDQLPNNKRKLSLIENKDLAMLSYQLVKLNDSVITKESLDDLRIKISHIEQFKEFLRKHNFKSLYAKAEKICADFYSKNGQHHNLIKNSKIVEFKNVNDLEMWLTKKTALTGLLVLIYEANLLCITCGTQETIVVDCANSGIFGLKMQEVAMKITPFINDAAITKILHDAKRFYHVLSEYSVISEQAWQADDMQLISYVLNNGVHNHDLKSLMQQYQHLDENLEFKNWLCFATSTLLELWKQFKQRLVQEKLLVLYERIEKPLSAILFKMEKQGIKIDKLKLKEIAAEFTNRAAILEEAIYQLADCKFNIASPKQLSDVLYQKLALKTAKASSSTSAEILEELAAQGHLIADKLLQWRHLTKLVNTYANSLGNNIDNLNRVHTNFQMTITSTGRLSSISPNLQNIPTRTEDGIKIRSAFVAEDGCMLLSADYSQIELRLLAHMADINTLKKAFINNQDIHAITASEVFGVALPNVTHELRSRAKAINFGIIYGISAFGLANQLKISRSDAKNYIETYFQKYPGIVEYMEKTKKFVREHGFVETLLGRRCFIKNITDNNMALRNFAERAAINAPLQGSASDIIKKAMIQLDLEIKKNDLNANILLQVHDELLIEVKSEDVKKLSTLIKEIMENIISLSIPLSIKINTGRNWAEINK